MLQTHITSWDQIKDLDTLNEHLDRKPEDIDYDDPEVRFAFNELERQLYEKYGG